MAVELVTLGVVCADVMVRPVDHVPGKGALGLVPEMGLHLGGLAGVTAAVYCGLGGSAAFLGRIGTDSFGDFLLQSLRTHGVELDGLVRDPDHQSSSTVVLIDSSGERTFLHHIGTNGIVGESDLDFEIVENARVLHWGGPALTPQLDGAPMGRIFERARAMGVRTSMDTCYDGQGVWFPLIEPALPHLDVVFSSIEEARHYTGQETPENIAAFYQDHGVETVVVKLGADGLYLRTGETARHLPGHAVEVIDTTGAGDAACAGYLYGYIRDWDPLRCGALANAVGALTVQAMGGAGANATLADAMALMEEN